MTSSETKVTTTDNEAAPFSLTAYTRVCVYSSKFLRPYRMYIVLKAYSSFS